MARLTKMSTALTGGYFKFPNNVIVDYIDEWTLMKSPMPMLIIWASYIIFVFKAGPEYMKNRPAFRLHTLLALYNLFQISSAIYLYLSAKLIELLDTIFFVLRKKQNQVTFLHVYHHSVMLFSTWLTLKFEPSFSPIFLGTLNSFVHAIMYTYYGLSAFPSLTKCLWWKKYITTVQLWQFVMVFLHTLSNYAIGTCPPSYILLTTITFNSWFFLYLFGRFYINSYLKNEGKSCKTENGKKNNGFTKGNDENERSDGVAVKKMVTFLSSGIASAYQYEKSEQFVK
ncbi:elongation of very long chain fatty acids protein 7-like [Amyelois transitella]|uniref:elongation of very long chain fatty acids protein 7-like n=1 Tax=Amyelois transitella TaxID=680683 RepID=UPI00298FF0DB|nr:elongation of very long chain fatty acids protein 7-like [Amyelois transitella]